MKSFLKIRPIEYFHTISKLIVICHPITNTDEKPSLNNPRINLPTNEGFRP